MHNRKERITQCLVAAFIPIHLEVIDESNQHNVPQNAQTHFKVSLVCEQFQEMSKIKRHQQIHQLLKDEFTTGLHALSIRAFTPEEWQQRNGALQKSPKCKGGFKHG
jgi:BolA family transcriptional regulator, general stress-responsive regulator